MLVAAVETEAPMSGNMIAGVLWSGSAVEPLCCVGCVGCEGHCELRYMECGKSTWFFIFVVLSFLFYGFVRCCFVIFHCSFSVILSFVATDR